MAKKFEPSEERFYARLEARREHDKALRAGPDYFENRRNAKKVVEEFRKKWG